MIPTDTVYGLVCAPYSPDGVRALSELKERRLDQPVALLAATVDWLVDSVAELRGRSETIARGLLPGPYTLVLPNPAGRFRWLTGDRPDVIGVRVPDLTGPGRDVLDRVDAVAATSANRHGGVDPRRLDEVPGAILAGVSATLDGGELPGTPSTVLDLTGPEPQVLREGAVPAAEALARLTALLAE